MSDILIKGMEMPKNCTGCPICCGLPYQHRDVKGRRPDCPLIEIPTPHGRLGDLDALYEEISNGNKAYNGIEGYDGEYPNIANVDDCLEAIKYADTVIEAEGSET